MTRTAWDPYLEKDEKILWQGHPRHEFVLPKVEIPAILFGFAFIGFSVFWMIGASREGGVVWLFGLIFFGLGLKLLYRNLFEPTLRRRRTHYTLTDRRAFIATNMPFEGRKLKSYPIDRASQVELSIGSSPSVYFETERHWDRVNDTKIRSQIGFEHIDDGERVYALIQGIQAGEKAGATP